jgi:LmbE family N-acetylglucosaminyl deacetylase
MDVLAIVAHPDDETLGCGGTLLRHAQRGDRVSWLIATVCHEPQWSAPLIERKAQEVQAVAEAYGVRHLYKLGLPNAQLDTVPFGKLMDGIAGAVAEVRPEVVYVVHAGDVHTDHQLVHSATLCVLKPFHMRRLGVRRILSWETLSSTDAAPPRLERAFVPNVFHDVSEQIERKLQVMDLYQSEVQQGSMPRSVEALRALARVRGAAIDVPYAEAFMLVREIA